MLCSKIRVDDDLVCTARVSDVWIDRNFCLVRYTEVFERGIPPVFGLSIELDPFYAAREEGSSKGHF